MNNSVLLSTKKLLEQFWVAIAPIQVILRVKSSDYMFIKWENDQRKVPPSPTSLNRYGFKLAKHQEPNHEYFSKRTRIHVLCLTFGITTPSSNRNDGNLVLSRLIITDRGNLFIEVHTAIDDGKFIRTIRESRYFPIHVDTTGIAKEYLVMLLRAKPWLTQYLILNTKNF